jgi:uncharacterized membrane protein
MEVKANQHNPVSSGSTRPATFGSTARTLTLALATLTTGLVAGVFYAWSVSVIPGLAVLPDASYVASMNAMTRKIANPLFFASFLGAVPFLILALALHLRRPRTGRYRLIAAASVLYIVGGFLLTMVVNAPMSYGLTDVSPEAPARVLAEARNAYEGPWNFWHGVRTVSSILAFVALIGACLLRDDRA